MTKKTYRIIFEGKTLPGTTIEDVKKKLRSAFKGNTDRFDRLFARLPVVLAKDVPHGTAVKYKRLLEKAGALCRVEELTAPRPQVQDDVAPSRHEPKESQQISLPHEFYVQPKVKLALVVVSAFFVISTALVLWLLHMVVSGELATSMLVCLGLLISIDAFFVGFTIWRIMKPLVYLSEEGIRISPLPFFCKKAMWREIDGMAVLGGLQDGMVKLNLKMK